MAQGNVPGLQEQCAVVRNTGLPTWPIEMDIVYLEGSNKIRLMAQRPLIRAVIQDGIERTRASLMIQNAFLNLFQMLESIGEALVLVAEHNEAATDIHRCLLADNMYLFNMSHIVSSCI